MKKKVTLFIFNAFSNESKVLKEATSLNKHHYNVNLHIHSDKSIY